MAAYAEFVRRFVEVAESGSIQGAARALNISQPSLTQSVRRIEDMFGCRLFDRTKKGVLLTPMGERLYVRSRRMLDELALAGAEIADLLEGRNARLRLAAGTAWGYCFVPAILRALQARHPDLEVDLDIALTGEALPRLRAGRIDAFLGADAPDFAEEPGFERRPLIDIDYVAICGAGSPLARRDPLALADLADQPVIVYQDDVWLMDQVIARIEQRIGRRLDVAVRTKSLLATLELVRKGPYIAFTVRPIIAKFGDSGIRVLQFEETLYRFPTALFFRSSLLHSRPFQTMLSLLHDSQKLGLSR